VTVSGGQVVSAPNASTLQVASNPATGTVTVRVSATAANQ
jgi:hypothetical protein